ncbi:MAG TPA: hypothetical protein VEZ52_06050 [Desulfovibrio sp.]|uniref:hypothetical protein n=1 Tax=Desulfovibrio sp. TaxID=885 RepID=UPI002D4440FB|nr:hypothetical protein [Desulfovibrio sp.]HZF61169.1 hypothetical protein [Desulfovibrio sp.]
MILPAMAVSRVWAYLTSILLIACNEKQNSAAMAMAPTEIVRINFPRNVCSIWLIKTIPPGAIVKTNMGDLQRNIANKSHRQKLFAVYQSRVMRWYQ